jgi:hypothetical protein
MDEHLWRTIFKRTYSYTWVFENLVVGVVKSDKDIVMVLIVDQGIQKSSFISNRVCVI